MKTSEKLKKLQRFLESTLHNEIDEPDTEYAKMLELINHIDMVDTMRREAWNEETFGESNATADEVFQPCRDDIPF